MNPTLFANLWNAFWPRAAMTSQKLTLGWGKNITGLDDDAVANFLNDWARGNAWPPSLHELLVGVGEVKHELPTVTPTKQVEYRCDFCGAAIVGALAINDHIDAEHRDEIADTETVIAMIADWKAKRRPTAPPQSDEKNPQTGKAVESEELPLQTNPMNAVLAEGRYPTQEERAQLMVQQGNLDDLPEPGSDLHLDEPESAEITNETTENSDNSTNIPFELEGEIADTLPKPVAPPSNEPEIPVGGTRKPGCNQCGDKVPGVMFRTVGDKVFAVHCYGCAHLKCQNIHQLPVPSIKSRPEWKRFEWAFPEKKKATKAQRTKILNQGVANTHERLRHPMHSMPSNAREGTATASEPPPRSCETCGGPEARPGLIWTLFNGRTWEARCCPACKGHPLYSQESPMWPVVPEPGPDEEAFPMRVAMELAGMSKHAGPEFFKDGIKATRTRLGRTTTAAPALGARAGSLGEVTHAKGKPALPPGSGKGKSVVQEDDGPPL